MFSTKIIDYLFKNVVQTWLNQSCAVKLPLLTIVCSLSSKAYDMSALHINIIWNTRNRINSSNYLNSIESLVGFVAPNFESRKDNKLRILTHCPLCSVCDNPNFPHNDGLLFITTIAHIFPSVQQPQVIIILTLIRARLSLSRYICDSHSLCIIIISL